jgi:hypothetical protein
MKTDHRTQVYLPGPLHRQAIDHARRHNVSLSSVVREALGEYLIRSAKEPRADWTNDPLADLAGSLALPELEQGVALAEAIDATVYDDDTP